jgi:hypothetical protein
VLPELRNPHLKKTAQSLRLRSRPGCGGFATEAAVALVEFGWEELKLSRIVATVQEGNDVSTHILKKLGFELISTEPGPRSFLKFALNGPALV